MKISIFVTLGNIGNTPDYWQYAWREALESYCDFADEVVVVWGGDIIGIADINDAIPENIGTKVKVISKPWPYNFSWEEIAKHFNAGLEACTGDWIMKMDIDYILHEKDFDSLRVMLENAKDKGYELASFMKSTVLNKDKFYLKLAVPFIIRGDKKDKYKFGIPHGNNKSAWGYPIIADGGNERGLPTGNDLPENVDSVAFRTGIKVLNYDNTFRNKEITAEHFYRFSKARERAGFGLTWGNSKEQALKKFSEMFASRLKKTEGLSLKFDEHGGHPKYIKDRIEKLTPDLFGYNNWDNFKSIL